MQLGVEWPHDTVHVYRGWGEWARTLRSAASEAELAAGGRYCIDGAGRVHVRFASNGYPVWDRIKVCAQQYCGEALGTRDIF